MTPEMKPSILLPLYIYPQPGAWDILHTTISANPNLHFIVIVNPNSGPGYPPWWPNVDYVREIPKLNAQPNVQTVGYVATNYCKRSIEEVFNDISAYAKWPSTYSISGLSISGIFFDETPNKFSKETKDYLDKITVRVKDTHGILGNKVVIHNPGIVVDSQLADPGPDVTTVVEETYASFNTPEHQQWLEKSPYGRERSSYMIHSVPQEEVEPFTFDLCERAKYLFVTDLESDYYQSFGLSWNSFIEAMSKANKPIG